MINVRKLNNLVNQIARQLPKNKRRRYRTGLAVFGGGFRSLNAAGRALAARSGTGSSRVYRLLGDLPLSDLIQAALLKISLAGKTGQLWLNLDHSQIGGFTVAVLALQTRRGRALPLWCQVNPGRNNAAGRPLYEQLAKTLQTIRGDYPDLEVVIVGDRWFASAAMIDLCRRAEASFLFRTKADKRVQTPLGELPIGEIGRFDTQIRYRGMELRLLISGLPAGSKQPWFLLTNICGMSRTGLLNRYAQRWEIEATFKDMKWTQNLRACRVRKPGHLRCWLLFACLSWVLPYRAANKRVLFGELKGCHPKKLLSWFNYLFEQGWTRLAGFG